METAEIDAMLRRFANLVITKSHTEHKLVGRTAIMGVEFEVISFGFDSTIARPDLWLVGLYSYQHYHVILGEELFLEDLWLLRLLS